MKLIASTVDYAGRLLILISANRLSRYTFHQDRYRFQNAIAL